MKTSLPAPKARLLPLIFTVLLTSLFSAQPRAGGGNELAETKRAIELETAILKENPKAVPSPKLKALQAKALHLSEIEGQKAKKAVDKAAKKEVSSLSDKIVKYKDNLTDAADEAIKVADILEQGIDADARDLKRKIDRITGHKDIYDFLHRAGGDPADAKRVRRLSAKLASLEERKRTIQQHKAALIRGKKALKGFQTGVKSLSALDSLRKGNYLDTAEETLGIIQDYLPDHSGKIAALDATVKLLSETSGGTKAINKKLGKEMARISEYSQKLKRVEKLSKGIDHSLKAIGYIKKAKEVIDKSLGHYSDYLKLAEDGTTGKAGRDLIVGMGATGDVLKEIAQHLPPGLGDYVDYLGEAMKLPGTVNQVAKKWYEKRDTAVNVTGPLAQTRAGREYDGILDRDPLVNPDGSLGVYYDPDRHKYVLITDPDQPAIYISEKERNLIAQINSDLSATGKKLTNGMIEELRRNGYKTIVIPGLVGSEKIDVKTLAKEAERKREEARCRMLAAEALGVKHPSAKDVKAYAAFDDYVRFSERVYDYTLTERQKKRLFAKYREDPKGFRRFLDRYAKKHRHTAPKKPPLTQAQLERKEAEKRAKKLGIHKEDLAAYFNCLCRRCGGSLGGYYDPSFQGPGDGPCKCSGPLSIWKAPMGASKEETLSCVNTIAKINYAKDRAIFEKWHRAALEANARSVEKKVRRIRNVVKTMRDNWEEDTLEAAETFIAIEPLVLPRDKKYIRSIMTPRLRNIANNRVVEGDLDAAVRTLETALKVGGKEKNIRRDLARYEKWEKPWREVLEKKIPEISTLARSGKVVTAQKKLDAIHYAMSAQGGGKLPPVSKNGALIGVQKEIHRKKREMNDYLWETTQKVLRLEMQADPQSALALLDDYPKTWEIGQDTVRRLRARLRKGIAQARALAQEGDRLTSRGAVFEAMAKYTQSLKLQEDNQVRGRLEKLSHAPEKKRHKTATPAPASHAKTAANVPGTHPKNVKTAAKRPAGPVKSGKGTRRKPKGPVTGSGAGVTVSLAKEVYEPGEKIELAFKAPKSNDAWIGMYPAATPRRYDTKEITYQNLHGKTAGTQGYTAPTKEGAYEFRCFERKGHKKLAAVAFTVAVDKDAASLSLPKSRYEPGEKIELAFTASPLQDAWVGLYDAKAPRDYHAREISYLNLHHEPAGKLSFTAPVKEGTYRLRMYERSNEKELAALSFEVRVDKASATLSLPKKVYEPGEKLVVKFTASPLQDAWVGLYDAKTPRDYHAREISYLNLHKKPAGELTFTAPIKEGAYRLRMYERSNEKELATLPFTVAVNQKAVSLTLPKKLYAPGENVTLRFTASPLQDAWIGMYKAATKHDYRAPAVTYQNLYHKPEGTLTFTAPREAGAYAFRFYERSNEKELASIRFEVGKQ